MYPLHPLAFWPFTAALGLAGAMNLLATSTPALIARLTCLHPLTFAVSLLFWTCLQARTNLSRSEAPCASEQGPSFLHVAAVNLAGALLLTSSLLVSAPDSVCRPGAVPESLAVDLEKVNFNHFATMLIREWRGHAPPALYIRLGINTPPRQLSYSASLVCVTPPNQLTTTSLVFTDFKIRSNFHFALACARRTACAFFLSSSLCLVRYIL